MEKNYRQQKINLYDYPELYEKIIAYRFFEEEIDFINKAVKKYSSLKTNYTLLDLGGGPGKIISMLSKKNFNTYSIDKSFNMCLYAKKKYNVKTINSDFINPAIKNKYDVIIILFNTISYITDLSSMYNLFKFVRSSLEEKGLFIFSLTYFTNLEPPLEVSRWSILDDNYNEYNVKLYYTGPVDYENQTLYQNLEITDVSNKVVDYVSNKKMFLFPQTIKTIINNINGLTIKGFYNGPNIKDKLIQSDNVKSYYTVIQKL